LSLRPTSPLPGVALQAGAHRRGPSASLASLLFVPASSLWMSNWTSRERSSLPACAVCRPWWASRLPSIIDRYLRTELPLSKIERK
jgi:hypothetical protein